VNKANQASVHSVIFTYMYNLLPITPNKYFCLSIRQPDKMAGKGKHINLSGLSLHSNIEYCRPSFSSYN
jgi:hypothetical protein